MRSINSLWNEIRRRLSRKGHLPPHFVEADYLQANPDVAYAVRRGLVRSGADHWLASGAREGRRLTPGDDGAALPEDFDERAYLLINPDVRVAVEKGLFPDGAAHWLAVGHKDGRSFKTSYRNAEAPQRREGDWDALVAGSDLPHDRWRMRLYAESDGFDAAAYARTNPDVVESIGTDPDDLLQHWTREGFLDGRTPYNYAPYAGRTFRPDYWTKRDVVSFFGLLDANTGLGSSARGYLAALKKSGVPVAAHNVVDRGGRFEISGWSQSSGSLAKVNIFHLNADMTHRFFLDGRSEILDDSFNIAIWFWELSDFPSRWISAFGAFDEIWVASDFVRRSVASVAPIPVIKIPMVVAERAVANNLARSHFGLPKTPFVFACVFDVGSVIARKNPGAVITAFRQSFGSRDDVLLLLKYHGGNHYPESVADLLKLAGSAPNIRLFERNFTDQEMRSFTSTIDCFVSPHRSEGFGLNIAEAMLAGKPVIATGFSGNREFMTVENSYLVGYKLREIGQACGPYPGHSLWAEPNIDDVATLMRSVFEDRETAAAKAGIARADILAKHNVDTVSHAIKDRFGELQPFSPQPRFVTTWGGGLHARTIFYPAELVRFTVILVVDGTEGRDLHRSIRSMIEQAYPHWELIIHDEGQRLDTDIETLRASDPRIKIAIGLENQDAAASRNDALAFSSGQFIAWISRGDTLTMDALSEIAAAILNNPGVDVVTTESDDIRRVGASIDPEPRSAWPGDKVEGGRGRSLPHVTVTRRSRLLADLADGDFRLHRGDPAGKTVHLPKALLGRRKTN